MNREMNNAEILGITDEQVAEIILAAVKSYRSQLGQDFPQIDSAALDGILKGVKRERENREKGNFFTPEQNHNSWIQYRKDAGWEYGEKYDEESKKHPSMVDYSFLPLSERIKNDMFLSIIDLFYPDLRVD